MQKKLLLDYEKNILILLKEYNIIMKFRKRNQLITTEYIMKQNI